MTRRQTNVKKESAGTYRFAVEINLRTGKLNVGDGEYIPDPDD